MLMNRKPNKADATNRTGILNSNLIFYWMIRNNPFAVFNEHFQGVLKQDKKRLGSDK